MNSIMIDDLLKKDNTNIIDIRSHISYLQGHIPGAVNIEEKELYYNYEKYLDINNIYYLYCSSGIRSRLLANKLNELGYHVVSIRGCFYHYLLKK